MTHPLTAAIVRWAGLNFRTLGAAARWLRAHEPVADRPSFHSVDDVLRFAFGHEVATVKTTSAFKLAGRARDELWQDDDAKERAKSAPVRTRDPEVDRRPGGDDAVAQSAMILGFVRRLAKFDHLYVVSKYARGAEQMAARRALRDLLIPLLDSGTRPRYATYALICAHFGRKVDRDDLADRIEYLFPAKRAAQDARGAIRRLANNIDNLLKDIAASADSKCYERFKNGGLIK